MDDLRKYTPEDRANLEIQIIESHKQKYIAEFALLHSKYKNPATETKEHSSSSG